MLMAIIANVLVKSCIRWPTHNLMRIGLNLHTISHLVSKVKILYSLAWAIYKHLLWLEGIAALDGAFSLEPTLMDGVSKDT